MHDLVSVYSRLFQNGSQNTTYETDGVRYIYEPLDELFVVLVSESSTSNILQDIETLRLLTQLVKQTAAPNSVSVDGKDVAESTFNIMDAFDEVITMGYSENLTLSQVETFLRMESQEEKIQEIIERNKQLEAAESRKRKAKLLEAQRNNAGFEQPDLSRYVPEMEIRKEPTTEADYSSYEQREQPSYSGSGLRLGRKATEDSHEAELPVLPKETVKKNKPKPQVNLSTTNDISISEQLTIEMTRDNNVKTSRVSGTLNLFAGDREHNKLQISADILGNIADFKPHPKMDRANFASSKNLGLKNKEEGFPASNVLLVKWTVDNVKVPITFSCWVSDNGDGFQTVTLEYEVNPEFEGTLSNIAVRVPLPTPNAHVDDPESNFEQENDCMIWTIPSASSTSNQSGNFEFVSEADGEDDFYPIDVAFETVEQSSTKGDNKLVTFGQIDIDAVTESLSGEPIEFTKTAIASTASYVIRQYVCVCVYRHVCMRMCVVLREMCLLACVSQTMN